MNSNVSPFTIIPATAPQVPILISVPHCGVQFPEDRIAHFNSNLIKQPDDTDWYVHELYSFASALGITIIHANYSRWLIDLNRDPNSVPLYNDGRIITSLCPTTDFLGNELYVDKAFQPTSEEIKVRLQKYYWPYYNAISEQLNQLKSKFGHALLWDAHSIRKKVPTIRETAFPDLILGDNDEQSAKEKLIKIALNELQNSHFQVNHNHPFKGGHITRYFGKPENGISALQLEMTKLLYMDDKELNYHPERAQKVTNVLRPLFESLIKTIIS